MSDTNQKIELTLRVTIDADELDDLVRRVRADVARRLDDLELDAQKTVDHFAALEDRVKRIEEPRGL